MTSNVNSAADSATWGLFGVADRPELFEGGGSVNGGLVNARSLQDIVACAVASDGSLQTSGGRRVVSPVRLNDVVLDERATGPAVDREVAVAVGLVGASVTDCSVEDKVSI